MGILGADSMNYLREIIPISCQIRTLFKIIAGKTHDELSSRNPILNCRRGNSRRVGTRILAQHDEPVFGGDGADLDHFKADLMLVLSRSITDDPAQCRPCIAVRPEESTGNNVV